MISMEKVRAECKAWQPKSGQIRYYINNWKQISGIKLEYHRSGNLKSVNIGGEYKYISNSAWNKYCAGTMVWVGAEDEDNGIAYVDWYTEAPGVELTTVPLDHCEYDEHLGWKLRDEYVCEIPDDAEVSEYTEEETVVVV